MTIVQEIQKWSLDQDLWMQDAISRLYEKQTLDDRDYADIYALLKAQMGIHDPERRQPCKLDARHIAAPQAVDQLVQLTSIRNLRNVNALAEGQNLPIAPTGLTVIYGENGAGKSGYSRVLKKACRARDQREPILGNANHASMKGAVAQASFELLVDGCAVQVEWDAAKAAPEELSALAIFDTHCARAYLDNHGDFAYAPYGLDILESLVKACGKLKTMALQEQAAHKADLQPFATLKQTQTPVGKLLTSLSRNTKPEEVEKLATLSEAEVERLATVVKALTEADPKEKAKTLRIRAFRIRSLAERLAAVSALISDEKTQALSTLIAKRLATKEAAEFASGAFKESPGQLAGTGSNDWKLLVEAARTFAATSHPDAEYPHLGAEAQCPLCQNRLGEKGQARLAAFDAFIEAAAQQAAKLAKEEAVAAYRAIEQCSLDLAIDEALLTELFDISPHLSASCAAIQKSLINRRASILKAAVPNGNWEAVLPLTDDPRPSLLEEKAKIEAVAKALEDTAEAKSRLDMVAERIDLESRIRLCEMKKSVLGAITKLDMHEKLQNCANAAGTTTGISRKATDLARTMATPEVVAALNAELCALNVHELRIVMKNESPFGKTQFKLALELIGGEKPSAILSEGEQRAISIASFLAEVNLGGGRGGVVFDDPVSSLDHVRRWLVAERLAREAAHRQVIVFTHDIYFLCILQQKANEAGIEVIAQCIRKDIGGFGVQTNRLPFDALKTSKRISELRQMHIAVEKAQKIGAEDERKKLTREAYYHLRLAWERSVEEVLFQGVISRFGEGISTKMLRYVVVEDSDNEVINAGMTRCSKFEHDGALRAQVPVPTPTELKVDIESLETWRASVELRKLVVENRRRTAPRQPGIIHTAASMA